MAKHLFFVTGIIIVHLVAVTLQYPVVRPKNIPDDSWSYEDSESEPSSESELNSDSESESEEFVKALRTLHPIGSSILEKLIKKIMPGLMPRTFRTTGHRAVQALTDAPPTQAFFDLMKNILESLKSSTKAELRRAKERHTRNGAWKK